MKTVAQILGNYLLSYVAMVLPILLYPLNIIAQIIVSAKSKSSLKVASEMAKRDAISIDISYHSIYQELFKLTLFKRTFWSEVGHVNETLSYALARAWYAGELTWTGYAVGGTLNAVFIGDWRKGGHLKYTLKLYEE